MNAFLDGWRSGKLDAVGFVTPDGQGVPAAQVADEIKSLAGELAKDPPALRVSTKPKVSKDLGSAEITVNWPLAKDVSWEYTSPVQLARDEGKWRMVWSPSVVHPQLTKGDTLGVRRTAAARGTILDGAGAPIVEARPVVVVGVSPQKINDLPSLTKELDSAFKSIGQTVDMADLPSRVAAADPGAFIELIALRQEVYLRIRPRIHPLDGTVFREEMWQLPPTREFARSLLGSVGEVTKEIMDANPGKYAVGDQVGLSGLQRQYDDRLRGTPGVTVVFSRRDAEGKTADTQLWQTPPKAGTPLRTTIDPKVQTAADNALKAQPKRSALVAVRVSDGAVLAVANGPDGGGVNLALTAQVPPGSTFKMVSAFGLLDSGSVTIDTVVNCPKTFSAGGATFTNSDNFDLGQQPFRVDFARSCNTAFASQAPKLGDSGLSEAGKQLGIGTQWNIGTEAYNGTVPTGGSDADKAAAVFGQGKTLVSPIALAAATSTVARGRWEPPKLVTDPKPADAGTASQPLKQSTVDSLRTMMREVITKGTGTLLATVPGAPVYGKSGTAEFDSADKNKTHAWFIGWQGDIAFAVFVENGGGGGAVAGPLARAFLVNLAAAQG